MEGKQDDTESPEHPWWEKNQSAMRKNADSKVNERRDLTDHRNHEGENVTHVLNGRDPRAGVINMSRLKAPSFPGGNRTSVQCETRKRKVIYK